MSADKRDRRNPHANHAFSLISYGCGRHGVDLKITAPVSASGGVLVVCLPHTSRYLVELPKTHFPVIDRRSFHIPVGYGFDDFKWSDEGIFALCGFIGKDKANEDRSPYLTKIYKDYSINVDRLLAPDGNKPALWVEVPDWNRTGPSQKLFAATHVAALSGGRAISVNLGEAVISEALASRKGVAVFLRDRLRDRLKRLVGSPQFAFAIDLNTKGEDCHIHGALMVPEGISEARIRAVLESFAGSNAARTVSFPNWSDLPGGYGGYAAKSSFGVAAILERLAKECGGRTDQPTTTITQGLIAQARDYWNRTRLENRAQLLDLAAQDVSRPGYVAPALPTKRQKAVSDRIRSAPDAASRSDLVKGELKRRGK